MDLESRIFSSIPTKAEFLIASGTYLASAASDYLMTQAGLIGARINDISSAITEVNPVVNWFLSFSDDYGLLAQKVLMTGFALYITKLIDHGHKEKKTRCKAEYLLYPGSVLTSVAATGWIQGLIVDTYFRYCSSGLLQSLP